MTDKTELRRHLIGVGQQVETLKDNEAFRIVLTALKNGILSEMAETPPHDTASLSHHAYRLNAVREIEETVKSLVLAGANAAVEQAHEERLERMQQQQGARLG